jgi:hypothetical protein
MLPRHSGHSMKPDFANFSTLSCVRFHPSKVQVYDDAGGELAILDANSGIYYGLDQVGARVWSLLADWKTVGEIRDTLLEEYDVEVTQLEADLAHLFEDLFGKHLIEVTPPGAKRPQKKEATSEHH